MRRVPATRGGSTRPSEKKTIALRPGAVLRPFTRARTALIVASPCWSRSRASEASACPSRARGAPTRRSAAQGVRPCAAQSVQCATSSPEDSARSGPGTAAGLPPACTLGRSGSPTASSTGAAPGDAPGRLAEWKLVGVDSRTRSTASRAAAALLVKDVSVVQALVDAEDADLPGRGRGPLQPLDRRVVSRATGLRREPVEQKGEVERVLIAGRCGRRRRGEGWTRRRAAPPSRRRRCPRAGPRAPPAAARPRALRYRRLRSRTSRPFLSRTTRSTATRAAVTPTVWATAGVPVAGWTCCERERRRGRFGAGRDDGGQGQPRPRGGTRPRVHGGSLPQPTSWGCYTRLRRPPPPSPRFTAGAAGPAEPSHPDVRSGVPAVASSASRDASGSPPAPGGREGPGEGLSPFVPPGSLRQMTRSLGPGVKHRAGSALVDEVVS